MATMVSRVACEVQSRGADMWLQEGKVLDAQEELLHTPANGNVDVAPGPTYSRKLVIIVSCSLHWG